MVNIMGLENKYSSLNSTPLKYNNRAENFWNHMYAFVCFWLNKDNVYYTNMNGAVQPEFT